MRDRRLDCCDVSSGYMGCNQKGIRAVSDLQEMISLIFAPVAGLVAAITLGSLIVFAIAEMILTTFQD